MLQNNVALMNVVSQTKKKNIYELQRSYRACYSKTSVIEYLQYTHTNTQYSTVYSNINKSPPEGRPDGTWRSYKKNCLKLNWGKRAWELRRKRKSTR